MSALGFILIWASIFFVAIANWAEGKGYVSGLVGSGSISVGFVTAIIGALLMGAHF